MLYTVESLIGFMKELFNYLNFLRPKMQFFWQSRVTSKNYSFHLHLMDVIIRGSPFVISSYLVVSLFKVVYFVNLHIHSSQFVIFLRKLAYAVFNDSQVFSFDTSLLTNHLKLNKPIFNNQKKRPSHLFTGFWPNLIFFK